MNMDAETVSVLCATPAQQVERYNGVSVHMYSGGTQFESRGTGYTKSSRVYPQSPARIWL